MPCSLCKQFGHNIRTCPTVRDNTFSFVSRYEYTPPLPSPDNKKRSPTCNEIKIQEILFEHCTEIPEGLYMQLMDALVIK